MSDRKNIPIELARIHAQVPKTTKEKLEALAKDDRRSLAQMLVVLIEKAYEEGR